MPDCFGVLDRNLSCIPIDSIRAAASSTGNTSCLVSVSVSVDKAATTVESKVCVGTIIALPLNLGLYRRELSTDEFIQSMTAAVGGLGSVEKAKLDQYKSMVAEKFSQFDLDGSGGIRCYHHSVQFFLAAVVAPCLHQLHGAPCPAPTKPCTSH